MSSRLLTSELKSGRLKPDNTWVTHFPFIWLPTIAVTSALIGHIAAYRRFFLSFLSTQIGNGISISDNNLKRE